MSEIAALVFAGRLHHVRPRLTTLLEIEDEIGSLPDFAARLHSGDWRLSEVVTTAHILLSAAGCEADYTALGDEMLHRGIETYRRVIAGVLGVLTMTPAPATGERA